MLYQRFNADFVINGQFWSKKLQNCTALAAKAANISLGFKAKLGFHS
jgi:hypothetical protein